MGRTEALQEFNNERYKTEKDMDLDKSVNYMRYKLICDLISKEIASQPLRYPDKTRVKVVDIGCGPGHLTGQIKDLGVDVEGADLSDNSLEILKKKSLKGKKVDLEDTFPYKDSTFDVVVASEIIEHIIRTEFFLDELIRICKPGGILIITTPNVASLARRLMLLFGVNPYLEYKLYGGAGHVRYFTFKNMRSFLTEHGLKIEKLFSEAINLSFSGNVVTKLGARIFPALGRNIYSVSRKPE